MENIRQKIAEIITHTHKTPLEQADEILLLFSVSGRSKQLVLFADWLQYNGKWDLPEKQVKKFLDEQKQN